ncbi:MAG TPA: hypothetical protein VJ201_07130 [Candidatus Babeliales bacterium]|nr:hypothetical protein [Candidatus Babeliales bacterium]
MFKMYTKNISLVLIISSFTILPMNQSFKCKLDGLGGTIPDEACLASQFLKNQVHERTVRSTQKSLDVLWL